MAEQFDAIIIGSGQAGKPLSITLAKAGWKTALVERDHIGGTCINYGCTPTKTMVASARVAYLSRRSADYGVHTSDISVNLGEVIARKNRIVRDFRSSGERAIGAAPNLALLRGQARFTDSKTLEVRMNDGSMRTLTAPKILINAGGRPSNPQFPGCESVKSLDSTSIMELDELPRHLLVVGGGYIGLEFGQMFRRFGSDVTIVQRGPQLLGREDPDVAEEVAKILREDGVQILFNSEPSRVEAAPDRTIRLAVNTQAGSTTLSGSHLLLAIGRKPNTEDLNLPAAGVEADARGHVKVNERLETNVPGIYALGDVNGGPQFTHISYDDFRIIRSNFLEGGNATTTGRLVPYTLFTDPQLGRVGMTEIEARKQGRNIRVAKIPMSYVARALEMSESRGFMKAVVDADTKEILGCAVLSIEGGELMAMLEIAMMGRLPYTTLKDGVFAHPTLAESLNTLFMVMDQ